MIAGSRGTRPIRWCSRNIVNRSRCMRRYVDALIPIYEGPLGFDLVVGDWVAPHGQGGQSVLIFEYHGTYESTSVYTKASR
jgi:hypothetical protein